MKVWILNHYAGSMLLEKGGRHYNFAKYLGQQGYEPVVFCCNAKHNSRAEQYFDGNSLWQEHMAEEISTPFVFVKARAYVGNGKQRVLNMVDFYRNVKKAAKEYAKEHGKPDVILASSVHPLTLVAGIQLAKHFGVRCICEIRDLWPESIVAYSSRLKKSNPIIKLLYLGEKWIYKKADAIIFTMEGGRDYIIEKGWDTAHGGPVDSNKVHHINNGVDLEVFDYNRNHNAIKDPDLDDPDTFKVIYTGSLREVNDIGTLLTVAEIIQQNDNNRVKVLIYGDGDQREQLEQEAKNRLISDVVFKGLVQKNSIPYILSKANLCLLHWKPTPITKYGMSMNKFFEYFAAAKPILSNSVAGYDLIQKYQCGISKAIGSADEYAECIIKMSKTPESDFDTFCKNARCAAEDYNFKKLTSDLIEVIENV